MWDLLGPQEAALPSRNEAQLPVQGEMFLACCCILHQQTGQLGTAWPFLVQWGRRINTHLGAGKEEKTTERFHHAD